MVILENNRRFSSNASGKAENPKSNIEIVAPFGLRKMRKGHLTQRFGEDPEDKAKTGGPLVLIKVKREDCRK
jgi:hypothetical protein